MALIHIQVIYLNVDSASSDLDAPTVYRGGIHSFYRVLSYVSHCGTG